MREFNLRRRHGTYQPRSLGVLLALLTWSLPAAAAPERVVIFGSEQVVVPRPLSLDASLTQPPCTAPRYGVLESTGAGLSYRPSLAFWSVGRDAIVCPSLAEGTSSAVELVAAQPQVVTGYGFDSPPPVATTSLWTTVDPQSRLVVSGAAALRGLQGAGVQSGHLAAYVESRLQGGDFQGEGYQPTSGGQQVRLPRPGGGGLIETSWDPVVLMSWATTRASADVRVKLRRLTNDYEVWLEAGSGRATAPVPVAAGEHRLRLDWWRPFPELGVTRGGTRLFVDGRVVAQITLPLEVDEWTRPRAFRAGAVSDSPAPTFPFDIDELYVARSFGPGAALVQSDFEAGTPPEWDHDAMAPQVSAAAAISGQFGLEVPLAPSLRGSHLDPRPTQLEELRVTYGVRTVGWTDIELGAESLPMLAGERSTSQGWMPAFRWQLGRSTGTERFEFVARLDDGTERILPWIVPDGTARQVAVQWLAASDPRAADGVLRVFADGLLVGELTGLDNDGLRIDALRVGTWGQAAAYGTLAIDDLRAW